MRLAAMTAITAFLNLSFECEELRKGGTPEPPPRLSDPRVWSKTHTCFLKWSNLENI